jgi:hypothetical protein
MYSVALHVTTGLAAVSVALSDVKHCMGCNFIFSTFGFIALNVVAQL